MKRMLFTMRAVFPPLKPSRLRIPNLCYRVVPATADFAFEGDTIPRHSNTCIPPHTGGNLSSGKPVFVQAQLGIDTIDDRMLEPMTGVEPVTSSLPRMRSTN
jgi:hypothetical protein